MPEIGTERLEVWWPRRRRPCESCAAGECARCEIWTCPCTHLDATEMETK